MNAQGWLVAGLLIVFGLLLAIFPKKVRAVNAFWSEAFKGYKLDPDHIMQWPGTYRVAGIVLIALTLLFVIALFAEK